MKITIRQRELLQYLKGTKGRKIENWMLIQTITSCICRNWIVLDLSDKGLKLRLSAAGKIMADFEPPEYWNTLRDVSNMRKGLKSQSKQPLRLIK